MIPTYGQAARHYQLPDRADATSARGSRTEDFSDEGTLTITVKDDITNKIEQAVSHDSLRRYDVDASDGKTILSMLDDTMWAEFLGKLQVQIKKG